MPAQSILLAYFIFGNKKFKFEELNFSLSQNVLSRIIPTRFLILIFNLELTRENFELCFWYFYCVIVTFNSTFFQIFGQFTEYDTFSGAVDGMITFFTECGLYTVDLYLKFHHPPVNCWVNFQLLNRKRIGEWQINLNLSDDKDLGVSKCFFIQIFKDFQKF